MLEAMGRQTLRLRAPVHVAAGAAVVGEKEGTGPLAERLRPLTIDECAGQQHLIGEGKVLRRLIETDNVSSMIFWGPPGVGKTTLARIIANTTKSKFVDF